MFNNIQIVCKDTMFFRETIISVGKTDGFSEITVSVGWNMMIFSEYLLKITVFCELSKAVCEKTKATFGKSRYLCRRK